MGNFFDVFLNRNLPKGLKLMSEWKACRRSKHWW